MKRRTALIILSSIFVILLISLSLLYVRFSSRENKYESLKDICSYEETSDGIDISCESLIDSVSENDKEVCFDLLILSSTDELKEITLCEKRDHVNWTNPYENYSKLVPVNLTIEIKENFLNGLDVEAFKFSLINDSEVLSIIERTSVPGTNSLNIYLQSEEGILDKGYYLAQDGELKDNTLIFMKAEIEKIEVDDDNLVIYAIFYIKGRGKKVKFETSGVEVSQFVAGKEESVLLTKENLDIIDLSEQYHVGFNFDSQGNDVDEYAESIIPIHDEYFEISDIKIKFLIRY